MDWKKLPTGFPFLGWQEADCREGMEWVGLDFSQKCPG